MRLRHHFRLRTALVLGRLAVAYSTCLACGSLQTQIPDWLSESYGGPRLAVADTGAAARNLANLALVVAVAKLFRVTGPILDFGGGDGLLCRLLRDLRHDCWVYDRYAEPSYAQGFSSAPTDRFELVMAFEVFEHFAEPATEIAALFSARPRLVLGSTELYKGQDRDWWYLSPESGQHIFFYSERALKSIAEQRDYDIYLGNSFFLFSHRRIPAMTQLALGLLKPRTLRLVQCILPLLDHAGVAHDFDLLRGSAT